MSVHFKQGDEVFLLDGLSCVYVALSGSSHIVRPIYAGDDEGCAGATMGDPVMVDQVFTSPPTQRKHAEIEELDARIAGRREELRSLSADVRGLEARRKDALAKVQEVEGLEFLSRILTETPTHAVLLSRYGSIPKVETYAEAIKDRDTGNMKILQLVVGYNSREKKGVSWILRGYHGDVPVHVAFSEEEAKKIAQADVDKLLAGDGLAQAMACAAAGFVVSQEAINASAEVMRKRLEEMLKNQRKDVERYKAHVAETELKLAEIAKTCSEVK